MPSDTAAPIDSANASRSVGCTGAEKVSVIDIETGGLPFCALGNYPES
ncbi:hypothetical protein [Variovorax sp. Varisp36]